MRRPSLRASTLALVVLATWLVRLPRGEGAGGLNLDVNLYFYPIWEATYARIAAGTLPLWNPYQLAGIPWLATLQGGFFYPLHALYLVLPLHLGLAASHAVHLPLAALAMAAFARRVGLSAAAAWLAAVLFTLRGLFGLSLAAPNYIEAAAWMPLGALAVVDIARDRRRRGGVLLAIATALSFLAGYPQPTVYMIYAWATLLVALLLGAGTRPRGWVDASAAFGGALALGALAAAIQLAPALELVAGGTHRDLTPEAMSPFGLSFAGWILAPQAIAGGPFSWGVTALALGAVALLGRRMRPLAWWAIVVAVGSLVLSLGDRTPFFQLYRALPLLGSFRFPDRLIGVTDFAFAAAAAIGLDAVAGRREAEATVRPAAVGAVMVLVALVVVTWWGGVSAPLRLPVTAAAMVAGALVGLHAATGGRHLVAIAAGLAAVATAEVVLSPWQQLVTYSSRTVARYERFAPEYRAVAEQAGPDRAWFIGKAVYDLQPEHARKLATRYRYKTIDDYEPLAPRRQAEYFTYFAEGTVEYHRPPWLFAGGVDAVASPSGIAPPSTRRRLVDLAAVRFVVVPAGARARLPDVDAFLRAGGFVDRPFASPAFSLLENPHALPRAFVVYRTRPAPAPPALLAALSQASFDPLVASYVEGAPGFSAAADAPARGTPARIVADEEQAVEIEATLERPGLVVLADAVYPGWRATVDGAPATIVPTNHLFRGVAAPAGTHRIRFEYRPTSVMFGALGSILGWIAIAGAAFGARRGSRRG